MCGLNCRPWIAPISMEEEREREIERGVSTGQDRTVVRTGRSIAQEMCQCEMCKYSSVRNIKNIKKRILLLEIFD